MKVATNSTSNNSQPNCVLQQMAPASTATTQTTDYAVDLLSIKTEISKLKMIIATAMEQIKNAITSLTAPSSTSPSNNMDTEVDQSTAPHNPTPNSPNLSALINDLKHKIADFVHKTRALFQQEKCAIIPFHLTPMPTWIPLWTSVGLLSNSDLER